MVVSSLMCPHKKAEVCKKYHEIRNVLNFSKKKRKKLSVYVCVSKGVLIYSMRIYGGRVNTDGIYYSTSTPANEKQYY